MCLWHAFCSVLFQALIRSTELYRTVRNNAEQIWNRMLKFCSCFFTVSPIPEISPGGQDSVSAMCQQLSQGLSLLSRTDDFGPISTQSSTSSVAKQLFTTANNTPPGTSWTWSGYRIFLILTTGCYWIN